MLDGFERPRHLGNRSQAVLDRLPTEKRQRVRTVLGNSEQRFQPIAERFVAPVVQPHDAEFVGRGHARDEHARDRLDRQRVAGADAAVVEQQHDRSLRRPGRRGVGHGVERLQLDEMPVVLDLKVLLLEPGHRPIVVVEDDGVELDQVLRLLLILRRDRRRRSRRDDGDRQHSAVASQPHHLHDDALLAAAVELRVEHLFPGTQVERAGGNRAARPGVP